MTTINLLELNPSKKFKILFLHADSASDPSGYNQTQCEKLNAKLSEFSVFDIELFIVTNSQINGLELNQKNKNRLLILNELDQVIWSGEDLNFKDLGQVCLDFFKNFFEDVLNTDIFKWGNKINQNGDYMCNDCGFILTIDDDSDYKIGMSFPICDVCQAGEPEGPSGPNEAFWQKI